MKLSRIELETVHNAASLPHDGTRDVSVHIEKSICFGRPVYSVYFSGAGESVPGAVCIADKLPQAAVKSMRFQHGRVPADKLTAMYAELSRMV